MGPAKTYLGGFVTLGSIVLAFFAIVGLAVGDCGTPGCELTYGDRRLWTIGIIVGTVLANVAMWFLLTRSDRRS